MGLYPPDDPFLINTSLFGIPLVVRWYGVIIVSGAMLAGWIAAGRVRRRGYDPEHIWNLLLVGMISGIIGARAYYVLFEWPRFAGASWLEIGQPGDGRVGDPWSADRRCRRSGALYTLAAPAVAHLSRYCHASLPAGAGDRALGQLMNQEAYGSPTSLGFGVLIDEQHRIGLYRDMQQFRRYPVSSDYFSTNRSGISSVSGC